MSPRPGLINEADQTLKTNAKAFKCGSDLIFIGGGFGVNGSTFMGRVSTVQWANGRSA